MASNIFPEPIYIWRYSGLRRPAELFWPPVRLVRWEPPLTEPLKSFGTREFRHMIEPLAPMKWFRAVRHLQERLARFDREHPESLIRHGFHLCQLAPRSLRNLIRPGLEEPGFEQLLANGAFESAALGVIGSPMIYAAAKVRPDLFTIRVCLPGETPAAAVACSNLAVGLVKGWVQCLIRLEYRSLGIVAESSGRYPHNARTEQHPLPL